MKKIFLILIILSVSGSVLAASLPPCKKICDSTNRYYNPEVCKSHCGR